MSKLADCLRCGNKPDDIDYSSVTDRHGVGNQNVDISCSCGFNGSCPNSVIIFFDGDNPPHNLENILTNAWNQLNQPTEAEQ